MGCGHEKVGRGSSRGDGEPAMWYGAGLRRDRGGNQIPKVKLPAVITKACTPTHAPPTPKKSRGPCMFVTTPVSRTPAPPPLPPPLSTCLCTHLLRAAHVRRRPAPAVSRLLRRLPVDGAEVGADVEDAVEAVAAVEGHGQAKQTAWRGQDRPGQGRAEARQGRKTWTRPQGEGHSPIITMLSVKACVWLLDPRSLIYHT